MPLVVPELAGGSNDEWLNKLVGKKISESGPSDVTVCCCLLCRYFSYI